MKKIIVFALALLLSAPTAADWKDDFLKELTAMSGDLMKSLESQGLGDAKSSQVGATIGMLDGMSGMCIGFAGESGVPVPKPTIQEILRMHEVLLQGKSLEIPEIREVGVLCLNFVEEVLRKQGQSDAEIQVTGEVLVKVLIPRMRAALGLPPKQ